MRQAANEDAEAPGRRRRRRMRHAVKEKANLSGCKRVGWAQAANKEANAPGRRRRRWMRRALKRFKYK